MENQTQPLVCPSHSMQYVGVFVLGVIFGIGSFFTYFVFVTKENIYQQGFTDAKKMAQESDLGVVFRTQDYTRSISGTVTEIKGDNIIIHIRSLNPFDDSLLSDRSVVITKDTKITKTTQGDQALFQQEMEAFVRNMQTSKKTNIQPPQPPEPTVAVVGVSAIFVGDTITVISTENISKLKEFSASEIQI